MPIMEYSTADKIARRVKLLSSEQQAEVVKLLDELSPPPRSLWEMVKDWVDKIPEEELEKLPVDGSHNHDHYLYGSPKKR